MPTGIVMNFEEIFAARVHELRLKKVSVKNSLVKRLVCLIKQSVPLKAAAVPPVLQNW